MNCPECGSDDYGPVYRHITRPRRVKFGAMWVIATILTGGLALIAYLVWPRYDEELGIYWLNWCGDCHATQPIPTPMPESFAVN